MLFNTNVLLVVIGLPAHVHGKSDKASHEQAQRGALSNPSSGTNYLATNLAIDVVSAPSMQMQEQQVGQRQLELDVGVLIGDGDQKFSNKSKSSKICTGYRACDNNSATSIGGGSCRGAYSCFDNSGTFAVF